MGRGIEPGRGSCDQRSSEYRGTAAKFSPCPTWICAVCPVGKLDTNALVCQLAALTMNILRLPGQGGLLGPEAPVRHAAKRRRIKTVMQELIYRAGRLIQGGR